MQAAADGKPVEISYKLCSKPNWNAATRPAWDWIMFAYRIASPKLAEGHNPDKLTEEQVGVKDGWRLLTENEMRSCIGIYVNGTETWSCSDWLGEGPERWDCIERNTIRTRHPAGFYLSKPKLAEGSNPDKLTVDQVGQGYRLLSVEEVQAAKHEPLGAEIQIYRRSGEWEFPVSPWTTGWHITENQSFRTGKPAGFYLPKQKKFIPWTFDTAPKGAVLFRREKGFATLACAWHRNGIRFVDHESSYERVANLYEHSLDGGQTWSRCGVEVEQ